MGRSRTRSLRARLTLWNASVIAGVLVVHTVGVYLFVREELYEEMDHQLREDARSFSLLLGAAEDERGTQAPWRPVAGNGADPILLEAWDSDGRLLHREGAASLSLPEPPRGVDLDAVHSTRAVGGAPLRVLTMGGEVGSESRTIVRAARSEDRMRLELRELAMSMAFGFPVSVLLGCLGGYFLATRALNPVRRMAARAEMITAERLSERLPIEKADDELGRLGTVLNETLARLERSFESLRRFTADAAHELRTPLTALRTVGEVALQGSPGEKVERRVVESMLEEVHRLTALVDSLLLLSKAESDRIGVRKRPEDLSRIALEVAEWMEPLAAEREQRIVMRVERPAEALVDAQLVRRALLNILDNALKYSARGATIDIVVGSTTDSAMVEVVDRGCGIGAQHRDRIFERFYRVDTARSRETGGTGLGLSIALWAVRANGGVIDVESAVGEGSRFRVSFPMLSLRS